MDLQIRPVRGTAPERVIGVAWRCEEVRSEGGWYPYEVHPVISTLFDSPPCEVYPFVWYPYPYPLWFVLLFVLFNTTLASVQEILELGSCIVRSLSKKV